jgi:hypothetical protein
MRKIVILGFLLCFPGLYLIGQEQVQSPGESRINRENLALRPNSRDYTIVRKGNNHQRMVQMRTMAMMRNKQAILNRQMAMEHRRTRVQQQMMRNQNIRQRMVRQRGMHR